MALRSNKIIDEISDIDLGLINVTASTTKIVETSYFYDRENKNLLVTYTADGEKIKYVYGNGLIYMRARYYSVELMRFINEDIVLGDIGNSNSLNRYTYVEGNPATMVDPFGLEAEKASAKAWKWGTDILKTIAGVGIMCIPIPGAQAVGGIAGGYIAEGTYKAFTGEDSETAFLVGNTLGNLLGDLAGAKIYTGIEGMASKAAAAANKTSYAKSSGNDKNLEKILEVMKKGEKTPDGRNIISQLDEETKVLFRMDVGDNAHTILSKGYTEPVNHINIEIQKLGQNGSYKTKWDYHIILDGLGQVTDSFPLGVWTK